MRASRPFAVIFACLLLLAACGDSDSDSLSSGSEGTDATTTTATDDGAETTTTAGDDADGATTTTAAETATSSPAGDKPAVAAGEGEPPSELEIEDIVVGTGEEAVAGTPVEVHYVGVLYDDGEEFDSSWDRGATYEFTLGQGQVIPGWDEGVAGMKVGGRRRLVIPPDLAYGATGSGSVIGPDATLIFVVDLVAVDEPLEPVDLADKPEVEVPDPLPTELVTEDIRVGEGEELVEGSTAVVHLVGVTATNGEEFDSTWERDTPITFAAGLGQIIPGFDQGVAGMKVGGRRLIVIPPDLAFGEAGSGPIGPDETLILVVDLVAVR